jgi:hypothetical protein
LFHHSNCERSELSSLLFDVPTRLV